MSEYKPPIELEEFTLERFRISLQKIISIDLIENYQDSKEVQIILSQWRDEVRVQFFRDLACMKQEKTITFMTPESWWNFFKFRYKETWLIKRLKPVKFTKRIYNVEKMLVFPDFKIPHGKEFIKYFKIIQARLKT